MRDLEIRGAGNLVGAQQHGFIAAVGFDLYCRLLDEAMREIKGDYSPDNPEPEIKNCGLGLYSRRVPARPRPKDGVLPALSRRRPHC